MASWQQELDALVVEVRLPGAIYNTGLVIGSVLFTVSVGPASGKNVGSFT